MNCLMSSATILTFYELMIFRQLLFIIIFMANTKIWEMERSEPGPPLGNPDHHRG